MENVANEEELRCKVLNKISNKRFCNNELLWEIHFVENYQDEQSVIIMKIHHLISDGGGILGLLTYWSGLTNEQIKP
jgi:NRPS condensation-like uncharacterized protein